MEILLTAGELMEKGLWKQACEMKGYDEWCVNEGRMGSDEQIVFTEAEAKQLGIIQ